MVGCPSLMPIGDVGSLLIDDEVVSMDEGKAATLAPCNVSEVLLQIQCTMGSEPDLP